MENDSYFCIVILADFVILYWRTRRITFWIDILISLHIQKKPWFPIDSTICQTEAGLSSYMDF